MGIVLLIVGIVILLAAIISPLSIVIGGVIGGAFIVAGTVIQIKKSRIKVTCQGDCTFVELNAR